MEYQYNSGSILGGVAQANTSGAPVGAIPPLTARIIALTDRMRETGHKLAAHADAVHGAFPADGHATGAEQPCRSGAIGALEDALDELERTHLMVATEAARNCTLV